MGVILNDRDTKHWSWRACNDKTWLAGIISILYERKVIKYVSFPLCSADPPSHTEPVAMASFAPDTSKNTSGSDIVQCRRNWSLRTCVMLLIGSRPIVSYFLLDSSPSQQLNAWQRCCLNLVDYRTPEIAEHHQFSRWMTWDTKSDASDKEWLIWIIAQEYSHDTRTQSLPWLPMSLFLTASL